MRLCCRTSRRTWWPASSFPQLTPASTGNKPTQEASKRPIKQGSLVNVICQAPDGVFTDFDSNLIQTGVSYNLAITDAGYAAPDNIQRRVRRVFSGSHACIELDLDTLYGANDYLRVGRLLGNNSFDLMLNGCLFRRQWNNDWKTGTVADTTASATFAALDAIDKGIAGQPLLTDYGNGGPAQTITLNAYYKCDQRLSFTGGGGVNSNF